MTTMSFSPNPFGFIAVRISSSTASIIDEVSTTEINLIGSPSGLALAEGPPPNWNTKLAISRVFLQFSRSSASAQGEPPSGIKKPRS